MMTPLWSGTLFVVQISRRGKSVFYSYYYCNCLSRRHTALCITIPFVRGQDLFDSCRSPLNRAMCPKIKGVVKGCGDIGLIHLVTECDILHALRFLVLSFVQCWFKCLLKKRNISIFLQWVVNFTILFSWCLAVAEVEVRQNFDSFRLIFQLLFPRRST